MSFITKRHIPRRTFLKGAGVHAGAAAARSDGAGEHRAGADRAGQTPKPRSSASSSRTAWRRATGSRQPKARCRTSCPTSSSRSRSVKDQTVVLSGLWSKSAEPPEGTTGSDHWVAAAFLTGIKPRKTAGSDATVGSPTIDQLIAQKIGQETLLPSLQLAVEDPNSSSSNCGEGYSCSYTNSISWVELPTPPNETVPRTSPLPMELNPQVVFERLFGSGATPEVRAQRMKQSQQHPRLAASSELGEPAQAARRRRSCERSTSTPTRSARSSAAFSSRRRRRATCRSSICRRAFRSSSTSTSSCTSTWLALAFKADITRVATLLGARDLTEPRLPVPEERAVPRRRHQRQLPRRLAPSGRSGADPPLRRRSTATTCRRWRIWPRS